jgi:hypothetical protein
MLDEGNICSYLPYVNEAANLQGNAKFRPKYTVPCGIFLYVHKEVRTYVFIIVIIIISGSTVLVTTLAASHRRFRSLIKTHGRTPLNE